MLFRRKQEEAEEISRSRRKEPQDDYEWDKRRIAIFLLLFTVVVLAGLEVKRNFFQNTSILGVTTHREIQKPNIAPPHLNISKVSSSIEDIKHNIQSLDAGEIASSSPQIQKVLRDIQGIKDLPANQARDMCLKICSGI